MKVISVENLSKTYRLGQIGAPSESTRPFAALRMLREGELRESSRADLEAWWAKLRGAWRPIPCFDTVSERRTVSASLRIGEKDYARDEYGIINVYGK